MMMAVAAFVVCGVTAFTLIARLTAGRRRRI
jgi:hypothetical protein